MNYCTKQNLKWYLSGAFIVDKIRDILHWIQKKPPLWPDADSKQCPRIFCRYCGGHTVEFFLHIRRALSGRCTQCGSDRIIEYGYYGFTRCQDCGKKR